ncbi:MAG: tRNA epoxyqueuosine(34) reductase QueG [Ignavibacteria bacterium]|nr:tRNA epoxyqueuosine(34) reductase QueG [Ignavibacteria bacterium]
MQTQKNSNVSLEGKIKAEAIRLGFSLCGFTSPESPVEFKRFEKWLSGGQQAGMVYLESPRHLILRQHPDQLVSGVKTIISLAWPYALQHEEKDDSTIKPMIAGYTNGMDYHLMLPAKLNQLVDFIQNEIDVEFHTQAFTDSAPILERELASRAGLGWIGKNSCLISPEIGSAFLLAELFIDFPLHPDLPFTDDRCGTCHRCLDACPTACIQTDRTIDSNKCISYLTIEHKGSLPVELRPSIGKWLFGCDICQTVCPWNRTGQSQSFHRDYAKWSSEEVEGILSITRDEFTNHFKETALYRTKLKGLQRNALIWLGNNGDDKKTAVIEAFVLRTTDVDLFESANWAVNKIVQT